MYIPKHYREDDVHTLVAFARSHSFAILTSVVEGVPFATHVPLLVEMREGSLYIQGHLARENPHCQALGAGESLAVFSGPHAYISPSLYENRMSVPTWNYIAVHAYGVPRAITSADAPEAMDRMIQQTIETYEADYGSTWQQAPAQFREGMTGAIVGFEMPVTRLEGKYKLSQNRSRADRQNIARVLLADPDSTVRAVGEAMAAGIGEIQ